MSTEIQELAEGIKRRDETVISHARDYIFSNPLFQYQARLDALKDILTAKRVAKVIHPHQNDFGIQTFTHIHLIPELDHGAIIELGGALNEKPNDEGLDTLALFAESCIEGLIECNTKEERHLLRSFLNYVTMKSRDDFFDEAYDRLYHSIRPIKIEEKSTRDLDLILAFFDDEEEDDIAEDKDYELDQKRKEDKKIIGIGKYDPKKIIEIGKFEPTTSKSYLTSLKLITNQIISGEKSLPQDHNEVFLELVKKVLILHLKMGNLEGKMYACEALSHYDGKEVLDTLEKVLNDETYPNGIKLEAALSLKTIIERNKLDITQNLLTAIESMQAAETVINELRIFRDGAKCIFYCDEEWEKNEDRILIAITTLTTYLSGEMREGDIIDEDLKERLDRTIVYELSKAISYGTKNMERAVLEALSHSERKEAEEAILKRKQTALNNEDVQKIAASAAASFRKKLEAREAREDGVMSQKPTTPPKTNEAKRQQIKGRR